MNYQENQRIDQAVSTIDWLRDLCNDQEGKIGELEDEITRLNDVIAIGVDYENELQKTVQEKDSRIEELEKELENWKLS